MIPGVLHAQAATSWAHEPPMGRAYLKKEKKLRAQRASRAKRALTFGKGLYADGNFFTVKLH